MSKQLKKLLIFLSLLLAVVWCIQLAIDTAYKKRVSNKFTKVMKHQTDAEIMLFGSSIVYNHFNPKIISSITGLDAYNMGFSGLFFVQYSGLIKEYLTYQKRCKVLVIGCDFDNLGKNEFMTRPDLFLPYAGNSNIYQSFYEIEPRKAFMSRYIPGFKLTLLNKAFYTRIILNQPAADTNSGYEAMSDNWEATKKEPFNSRYEEHIFELLKETILSITARGIKVVFVIPPVYSEGYKLILNAEMIKNKYRSLVGKNIWFLDYTTDTMCANRNYFHNFTHLNGQGAALFSHTFAQDLTKIIHE